MNKFFYQENELNIAKYQFDFCKYKDSKKIWM